MPPFANHHFKKDKSDNFISKNSVFKAPRCTIEDIDAIIGIRELQEIVENFATKADVSPYMVLKKLFERMQNRKDSSVAFLNTLEGADLQQLLKPTLDLDSAVDHLPHPPTMTPYEVVSTNVGNKDPFIIIPHHVNSGIENGKTTMTQFFPLMAPFHQPFVPPETATVHVSSLPDISVTVSPFMSVVEALRQADTGYRATFGIKANFGFMRSVVHGAECTIIKDILGIFEDQDYTWKITINDRKGQIIYHDICLPDEKEIRVKPGTGITVSYTSL